MAEVKVQLDLSRVTLERRRDLPTPTVTVLTLP